MTPDFERLGSIGGAVLASALLLAAGFCLGTLVVRPPGRRGVRLLDTALLRITVGLNLVAVIGICMGQLKLLSGRRSGWLLAAIAAAGVVLLVREKEHWLKHWHAAVHHGHKSIWLVFSVALLFGLVTLGPALCYPTGWDELVYHHELPRRWLADGWPAFYADLPYSGFPSLGEVLFWLVAPIDYAIAPRLLAWLCWIIGLMGLYRLLRRRLKRGSASVLALVFASSGAVLMISANCYIETIQMMNVAGLLLVTSRRRTLFAKSELEQAVLIGILSGGAAAVKLTGLPIAAVPLLWYLLGRWKWHTPRPLRSPAWRQAVICVAIASAIALPFYVRPWRLTGNPFYPYYAGLFSEDAARLEMSRYHHALGANFGVRSAAAFLEAPILLAHDDPLIPLYDGEFGWQFPLLALLAVLALAGISQPRLRRQALWPALVAACLYSFWFFTAQQARFLVPGALALMPVAAAGFRRFGSTHRKYLLGLLLVATLVSVPWRNAGHYFGSWLAAIGVVKPSEYVRISLARDASDNEYLPLLRALAEHTPPDAKIMVLFEHRTFYFPRRHMIATPFFQEASFTRPEEFTSVDDFVKVFRREQATHVLISNAPAGPDQASGYFDRLERFLPLFGECRKQGKLRIVWESPRYILLEIE